MCILLLLVWIYGLLFSFYLIGCKDGFCEVIHYVFNYINETLFQIHHSILIVIADPSRFIRGHTVAQLVEALCYKSEGRGFDSRWCHWNFSVT